MENTKRKPIPCPQCSREKYFEGICNWCRCENERKEFQAMNDEQVAQRFDGITQEIQETGKLDIKYNDFFGLLAYKNINTEKIADLAFEKKIFFPEEMYINASAKVIEGMLIMLEKPDKKTSVNNILCCLAMNGSKRVQEKFLDFERNPPKWRKDLHVNPSVYAECGGWSFNENGTQEQLIYSHCYALEREEREDNAVIVGNKCDEKCSVCSSDLIDILTIDGNDERLKFLGINDKITLPICPSCIVMSEKIFIRYSENSKSTIEEIVEPFDADIIDQEYTQNLINQTKTLRLSLNEVQRYYARANDEICTIGGQADWIQDFQYEKCPDCQKKMKLLASLSWSKLHNEFEEGTLFIEHCSDCKTAVAFHQQT